eukprot:NODE_3476_length_396_cov_373.074928_g2933_i0.p1 GENE.NODE_3476_length_396_cov_373.074928_g2933_i0~~NODE_3476_length_396_cov_373.074928_g2933_i0.p1  ORF type:complete len:65 (-),score=8.93 NODE_3476_length_396_cov_373.074928_g2933_i0:123-317(-)
MMSVVMTSFRRAYAKAAASLQRRLTRLLLRQRPLQVATQQPPRVLEAFRGAFEPYEALAKLRRP